jgi:hypothetical protein
MQQQSSCKPAPQFGNAGPLSWLNKPRSKNRARLEPAAVSLEKMATAGNQSRGKRRRRAATKEGINGGCGGAGVGGRLPPHELQNLLVPSAAPRCWHFCQKQMGGERAALPLRLLLLCHIEFFKKCHQIYV